MYFREQHNGILRILNERVDDFNYLVLLDAYKKGKITPRLQDIIREEKNYIKIAIGNNKKQIGQ